jgi:hypothetical protein
MSTGSTHRADDMAGNAGGRALAGAGSWREARRQGPRRSSVGRRIVLLFLVAVGALLLSVALVLAPLANWETAGISITISDYPVGGLRPVPFATEDTAALEDVLSGRLSRATGRQLQRMEEFATSVALRDRLFAFMHDFSVRPQDTLFAYVRGQSLVGSSRDEAGAIDPADPHASRACLIANDFAVSGQHIGGLVAWRQVAESLGYARNHNTVMAFDLGDLDWDPRLGVICSLVARQFDGDMRSAQSRAFGHNWVLASHDLFEQSNCSGRHRRTFFSLAIERALRGDADLAPWGDGDGVVELHEFAPAVATWTADWVRLETAGRNVQRPVLWKLGVGRVAFADVPHNIPVIRVGERQSSTASWFDRLLGRAKAAGGGMVESTARQAVSSESRGVPLPPASGTSSDGPEPVVAKQPTDLARAASATEQTAGDARVAQAPEKAAVPAVDNPWSLLETWGPPGAAPAGRASPVVVPRLTLCDSSPHVLRWATRLLAQKDSLRSLRAAKQPPQESPSAVEATGASAATILPDEGVDGSQAVVAALEEAKRAMVASDYGQRWDDLSEAVRAILASRNISIERMVDLIEAVGRLSGGVMPQHVDERLLGEATLSIARSSAIMRRLETAAADQIAAMQPDLSAAVVASRLTAGMLQRASDRLLSSRLGEPVESNAPLQDRLILLESLRLDATRRQALQAKYRGGVAGDAGRLPTRGSVGQLALDPLDGKAVANLTRLVKMWLALIEAVIIGDARAIGPDGLVQEIADELAAVREETESLADLAGGDDELRVVEAILRVAGTMAKLMSNMAATVAVLPPTGAEQQWTRDGLLRLVDARDFEAIGAQVIGGVPRVLPANLAGIAIQLISDVQLGSDGIVQLEVRMNEQPESTADVRFLYDAAQIELRTADGTVLPADVTISSSELPWRGTALRLVAVRQRPGRVSPDEPQAVVAVELVQQGKKQWDELKLPVFGSGAIGVVVRGPAGSVRGVEREERWHGSLPLLADQAGTLPQIALRGLAGRRTRWELGLSLSGGEPRTLSVELHAAGTSMAEGSRWQQLLERLRQANDSPEPLLASKPIELGAGDTKALSLVTPAEARGDAAKDAGPKNPDRPAGTTDTPAASPAPTLVGDQLLVVVRDEKQSDRPVVALTELVLESRHPREFLDAVAVFSAAERSIRVLIEPVPGAVGMPPSMRVELQPRPNTPPGSIAEGGSQRLSVSGVVARKPVAIVGGPARAEALEAAWNGPDGAPAGFTLDVDGYPRAFLFRVDCSKSQDGLPQRAERDPRSVRFLEPNADGTAVRAPTERVPFALEVDAPADAFPVGRSGDSSPLKLLWRDDGSAAASAAGREVWSGFRDRMLLFSRPADANGLELDLAVQDWKIEVSGAGLANVDVTAELRLSVPGLEGGAVDSRRLIFDATAPLLDLPPAYAVEAGRPLDVAFRASDDVSDDFFVPPERRRPGVSGLEAVEWAIDLKGDGAPEAWTSAIWLGGVDYVIRAPTDKLPLGNRLPLLVRARDRVGLSRPPGRVWLDVAAAPMSRKNDLAGRVLFEGRGEEGVAISLSGPGGQQTTRSNKDGGFRFSGLEPGDYRLSAAGAVRNVSRRAEPVSVTVAPAPAAVAGVVLELK